MANKKLLFLLIFTAPVLFSMDNDQNYWIVKLPTKNLTQQIRNNQSINSQEIKKEASLFFNDFFNNNLQTIGKNFKELSLPARRRVLGTCGDAKPFIMMAACFDSGIPQEIMLQLYNDDKAVLMFCNKPIEDILNSCTQGLKRQQRSKVAQLPLGVFCRITDPHTYELLYKCVQSTQKKYLLADSEKKELTHLLEQEPAFKDPLNIKGKCLHIDPPQTQKDIFLTTASTGSVPYLINYFNITVKTTFFGQALCILGGLFCVSIKNVSALSTIFNISNKLYQGCGLSNTFIVAMSYYKYRNIYNDNLDNYVEQTKETIN